MKQKEFLSQLEEVYKNNLEISRQKNTDYAASEAFHNFNLVETLGVTTTEKGILVRMCDKMTRIANLLENEAEVKDESILDTLADLCNYSAILSVYLKNKK